MKKISFSVLALILTFSSLVSLVYAPFSHTDVPLSNTYVAEYPENQQVLHSTGICFYAYYDTVANNLRIIKFGSDGSILANNTITLDSPPHSAHDQYTRISLYELDSDEIGIAVVREHASDTQLFVMIRYHINTYVDTQYSVYCSGAYSNRASPIEIVEHNNALYSIFTNNHPSESARVYLTVVRFNITTNAIAKIIESSLDTFTSSNFPPSIGVYQNASNTKDVYVVTSLNDVVGQPVYYRIDLDGATNSLLATHPFTTDYDRQRRLHHIGGGWETDGNYEILYFTWSMSTHIGITKVVRVIHHRLQFNQTIAQANLTAQNRRIAIISPELEGDAVEYIWSLGYHDDRDTFYVYFPNSPSGIDQTYRATFNAPNWLSFAVETLTYSDEYDNTIPWNNDVDVIGKQLESPYQTVENELADFTEMYYGLLPMSGSYDITASYTPSDSPLITDTQYAFTFSTTRNGIAYQSVLVGLLDDSQIFAEQTDALGVLERNIVVNIGGLREITLMMYDGTTNVYNETFNYLFEHRDYPDTPTSTILLPQSITVILATLPALLIILLPAFALVGVDKEHGGILFMVGITLGATIGSMSGIIPMAIMYIVLLCDAIILVAIMRR